MKKHTAVGIWFIGLIVLMLPVCAFAQEVAGAKAVAVLSPTANNSVRGIVSFIPVTGGLKVIADVEGLTAGLHGFHIHEYGDCRSSDGVSAGGHFNPTGKAHGAPADPDRHVGDLGNLTADASGKAHLEWTDKILTMTGSSSIVGRSVIVHASPDDLKSQPAGNSGPRIACGVIGLAK